MFQNHNFDDLLASLDGAIAAQSNTCVSIGLHPITVLKFMTDDEGLKQFLAGKSMAHVTGLILQRIFPKAHGALPRLVRGGGVVIS